MKKVVEKIRYFYFLLLSTVILLLTGCQNLFSPSWDEPVKAYFKKYTETAAVEQHEFPSLAVVNPSGVTCIPSGDDQEIKLLLRNPQAYDLQMHYVYDNAEFPQDDGVTFTPDPSVNDFSSYILTFSADKLKLIDGKTTEGGKNQFISGSVTLTEPMSGRSFESYPIAVNVNSAPLAVKNAMLQLENEGSGNYILCFHAPVTAGTVHKDINQITINGDSYTYNSDGTVTDSLFSSSKTVYPLHDGGFNFNSTAPTGYKSLYYDTGIDMATNGANEVRFSITLRDQGGLSTTSYISTTAEKLREPIINIEDTNAADEDTGYFTFTITHNGKSFTQQDVTTTDEETGTSTTTTVTEEHDCGAVTINYSITKSGVSGTYKTGSANGTATIKLPKGVYAITTWATKAYYVASDEKSVSDKKVTLTPTFYISDSGSDDEGTGKRAYPYRTILKALNAFVTGISDGDYMDAATTVCNIRVVSNLTAPEDFWTSTPAPAAFIKIPSLASASIKITGYGGTYTVNAGTPSGDGKRIFTTASGSAAVEIENLKFTGDSTLMAGQIQTSNTFTMTDCEIYGLDTGLSIQSGSPNLTNVKIHNNKVQGINVSSGTLECTNCNIYENGLTCGSGSLNTGAGIKISSSAQVTLKGGSVTGNVAQNSTTTGGGIYNQGTLTLDGSTTAGVVTITGNKAGANGGGIYSAGTLKLNGVVKITGNTKPDASAASGTVASNVYMNPGSLITIEGNLTGSEIGINVPWVASDAGAPAIGTPADFTTGYDYGHTNTVKPGVIFKAENGYGVTFNGTSKEAAFAVSSGAMYTALDYNFTFALKDALNNAAYGFMPGKGATFTLIPTVKRTEPGAATPTTLHYNPADKKVYENYDSSTGTYDVEVAGGAGVVLTANLWDGSSKVCDITPAQTAAGIKVTIPTTVTYQDTYTLKVCASYLGINHDNEFALACNNSAENAAAYISTLTAAGTYNVTVEGAVGSGVDNTAGNETTVTADDEGLAKVAKAIRAKNGTGVKINLNAAGTSMGSSISTYNTGAYFKNCENLLSITLPDWMEYVIPNLFNGCTNLTSVTLSPNTQWICQNAFKDCSKLASITIPEGITGSGTTHGIQAGAFTGCKSGFAITYLGTKEQWGQVNRSNQNNDSTKWHDGAKQSSETTGSVTCSDGSVCGLDYIIVPDYINTIATLSGECNLKITGSNIDGLAAAINNRYAEEPSLRINLDLSDVPVTSFELHVHYGVKSIVLPASLTAFDYYDTQYSWGTHIESYSISASNPNFSTDDGVVYNKNKTKLVLYPRNKQDEEFTLPDTVIEIGDEAFAGSQCKKVNGLSQIKTFGGSNVFQGSKITEADLSGLTQSNLPMYCFENCSSLTKVTLSSSITSFGWNEFRSCGALTEVRFKGTTPPTLTYANSLPEFSYCNSSLRFYVPAGAKTTYLSATGVITEDEKTKRGNFADSAVNAFASSLSSRIIE